MKIALLLTGQLRTIDLLKYLYLHGIIEKYDTDVFMSINLGNSQLEKVNELITFFKSKRHFVLDNFVDDKSFRFIREYNIMYQQYFIVDKAYRLVKEYIDETGTHYDIIVRLRLDQFLYPENFNDIYPKLDKNELGDIVYNENNISRFKNEIKDCKIPFYHVENREIYVLGYGKYDWFDYVNDQFFYHDSTLIDTMLLYYKNLSRILSNVIEQEHNNGMCIYERIFNIFLKENNLIIKKANLGSHFIRTL
jgi:hypothetical protein